MRILRLALLLPAMLFLNCGGTPTLNHSPLSRMDLWAETTLARLTLEEKVAQLIHVWTPARYFPEDSREWEELARLAARRKIGGFIFSIGDVYEYAVQLNKLQALADVPLLISGDFEYGVGMRVRHSTTFPRAMALGATRNVRYAYEMGLATAREGRALGVHQNYAPTIDVNNNPMNPVINTRAFGDDVALVSEMGAAFVRGTQDGGMIATVKHFPGHGDTDVDTHLGLTVLQFDRHRLESVELAPFREALKAGALSVMVGHIAVPQLDSAAELPGTVSSAITSKLLQEELGFSGLIVTDAMVMHGVATRFRPDEAVVLALKAGNDLILMPVDADLAIDAIVAAVKRGELPEERINRSVLKLLKLKQQFGLHLNRYVDVEKVSSIVNSLPHQMLALSIARDAVTVLGNERGILPFPPAGSERILDLVIADTEDASIGRNFHTLLRERRRNTEFAKLDPRSNALEFDTALKKALAADIILLQLHLYTRSGEMTGFVQAQQKEFIEKLVALGKPIVAISFGNPYVAMDLPRFDAYLCAYSDAEVMQQAVAEVLFAQSPARGKLPISIPGRYAFGEGVEYPKSTLRTGFPEEAGFDRRLLERVDDVMLAAVRDSAFPGGVLLVARNGVIVHHKAYGAYDYGLYAKRVDVNTIYDLASVTKVIATTSAVMKLVDEGKLRLEDPVVKHIPQFGQNGKSNITLYNLLVHNSGLPAWRRYYDFCTTPQCVLDSIYASPLVYRTGDSTIYSDLGLITLGKVIESASGTTLDRYVDSVFFRPLGMRSTMFNPPANLHERIAPTEVDTFWQRTGIAVRGRVHDENAATLGGVSGHAGLFSTASDLAVFMQMLLNGGSYSGQRFVKEETVRQFTARQSERSTRAIGWDTKNPIRSWAGTTLSEKTFLHTGFTGTSVAADPERNLIVVLLTNRVHPTRANGKIFEVRPQVHDAVGAAIVQ